MRSTTNDPGKSDVLDVLVIGGGQAGLVMGYHLKQGGLRFKIIDAGPEVGDTWRRRWDSLKLFTPAQYDDLPGLPFPAAADVYPSKDHVADFLQAYAERFELPVAVDTSVTSLMLDKGSFVAEAGEETFIAGQVVVATGPFQVPFVPPIAKDFDHDLPQIHSADYRNPDSVPEGRILVVGGANTGCQIALELSRSRDVEISVGQRLPTIPQRMLNRDVWWWGKRIGFTRVTTASRLGKRLSGRDVVIGGGLRELRKVGVTIRPRLTGAEGRTATFEGGESSKVEAVLWATGYRMDHSWIDIPGLRDDSGRIRQERGVTPVAGIYTVGLSWQHTRTSALLGWVTNDAEFIAKRIQSAAPDKASLPRHVV